MADLTRLDWKVKCAQNILDGCIVVPKAKLNKFELIRNKRFNSLADCLDNQIVLYWHDCDWKE